MPTTTTSAPTTTTSVPTTTTSAPTTTTSAPTTTTSVPTTTTSVPILGPFSNLYNIQDVSNGFSITPSSNTVNIGTELSTIQGVVTNLVRPIPSSIYLWDLKPNPYTWGPYSNVINAENIQTINNSYALQYTFNGTLNIGGINFSNGLVGNPNNNYNWNGYNGNYNFSRIGVYLLKNNTITTLLSKSIINPDGGKLQTIPLDNSVIINTGDKIFITLYVDIQNFSLSLGNLYFQPYVKPISTTVSDVSYTFTMNPALNNINIGSELSLDTNYYGGGTASTLIDLTKQTQLNWNVSSLYNQPDNNYIKIDGISPALQSSYALQYIFPDNTNISKILLKNGNLQPSQSWGIAPQYYPSRIYVYLLRNGQITNILNKTSDLPKNDTLTTIPLSSSRTVNSTDKIFVCLYNDNNDGTDRKWQYGMSLNLLYFT